MSIRLNVGISLRSIASRVGDSRGIHSKIIHGGDELPERSLVILELVGILV